MSVERSREAELRGREAELSRLPRVPEGARASIVAPPFERKGLSFGVGGTAGMQVIVPAASSAPPSSEVGRESPVETPTASAAAGTMMSRVIRSKATEPQTDHGWNQVISEELVTIGDNCLFYKKQCSDSSISNKRWNYFFQVTTILCSAISAAITFSGLDLEYKTYIVAGLSAIAVIANTIMGKMAFEQYAEKQYNGCLEFDKIRRQIQFELMKNVTNRTNASEFITTLDGRISDLLLSVQIPNLVREETSCRVSIGVT